MSQISARLIGYLMQCLFYALYGLARLVGWRIGIVPKSISIRPSRSLRIHSSKCNRIINVHVYEPPSSHADKPQPLPVYINFHGSAFVLPCHGTDAELCAYWASTLGCVVLDSDYAKAPQNPHPAAIDDAIDVLEYVYSEPGLYDARRVAVGGFSAGGNIAMLAALRAVRKGIVVNSVIAWYPPTDLSKVGDERKSSSMLMEHIYSATRMCYLPIGTDRTDPSVSPVFEDPNLFPPLTLIVGEDDKLYEDSVRLHRKLVGHGRACDAILSIPGASHAWERFVTENTPLWTERAAALKFMEGRLRRVFNTL